FSEHVGQLGERYNATSCISCHKHNARSPALQIGGVLENYSILTGASEGGAHETYGLNIQQFSHDADATNYTVILERYETQTRTLSGDETVELRKPVYHFSGPTPDAYSVRQAPQVIGMGLLEAVSEETILANVDANDINNDGVYGTPQWVTNPETGETHLGRFGWKAGKASVRHQTSEALLLDLSITSAPFRMKSCQKLVEGDCQ